jgi:hypothetical protein
MKRLFPVLVLLLTASNALATEGVVLLHGLSRSSASLEKIGKWCQAPFPRKRCLTP